MNSIRPGDSVTLNVTDTYDFTASPFIDVINVIGFVIAVLPDNVTVYVVWDDGQGVMSVHNINELRRIKV